MSASSLTAVSTAAAWRALHAIQLLPFDAGPIKWQGTRAAHAALKAVRAEDLKEVRTVDWTAGRQALSAFVGRTQGHCFSGEPHAWVDLLEPQITKGLAHFLNAGGSRVRTRRILALLQAVRPAEARTLDIIPEQVVSAHAVAEGQCGAGRRIDVVAWVQLSDGRRVGAVIEAKVGHHVTAGQLAPYEAAAAKPPYSLDERSTVFVIVAPSLTTATLKQLRRHPRWKFIPWRVLLTRLGGAVNTTGCDHDDFMRFRRTVWSCTA